jgi:enamine deaminase RidA (YjgF/YER057c/UK114 family)
MTTAYDRLSALQITLPDAAPPVVAGYTPLFAPYARTGNLIFLSGRLGKRDGKLLVGKLGAELSTAEGKEAARGVAIELLATLHSALGDLGALSRLMRMLVLVNSTPDFTEPHEVANGASELFMQVLGDRGVHARSAFGVAQVPFGACVEIELVAEVAS